MSKCINCGSRNFRVQNKGGVFSSICKDCNTIQMVQSIEEDKIQEIEIDKIDNMDLLREKVRVLEGMITYLDNDRKDLWRQNSEMAEQIRGLQHGEKE